MTAAPPALRGSFITRSPRETQELAARLVESTSGGLVVALHGQLGAGKTCFVQGMAAALGIRRFVTSPTFIIVNEYKGARPLYHIDLYRMGGASEALALGFEEYLESDGVTAVEWPERAAAVLPPQTVHVYLDVTDNPEERRITIGAPPSAAPQGG